MGRSTETFRTQTKQLVESAKRHPVATGFLVAAGVNKVAGEILYRNNGETRVVSHYEGPPSPATAIAWPGMGNSGKGGRDMAMEFSKIMPEESWGSMLYDNSRVLNLPTLTSALEKRIEETGAEFADHYTSSTGGVIALETSERAGIPIRRFILNSGPYSWHDGYGSKLGLLAAKLPDTGPFGKVVGTAVANIVRPGSMNTWENISHALGEIKGGSIKLFQGMVQILIDFNPDNNEMKYNNIIKPGFTEALFISPPAGMDDTVRVGQSFNGWYSFFESKGVRLDKAVMPNGIHAETKAAVEPVREWVNRPRGKKFVFSGGGN